MPLDATWESYLKSVANQHPSSIPNLKDPSVFDADRLDFLYVEAQKQVPPNAALAGEVRTIRTQQIFSKLNRDAGATESSLSVQELAKRFNEF